MAARHGDVAGAASARGDAIGTATTATARKRRRTTCLATRTTVVSGVVAVARSGATAGIAGEGEAAAGMKTWLATCLCTRAG